jgi:hypothetical protein
VLDLRANNIASMSALEGCFAYNAKFALHSEAGKRGIVFSCFLGEEGTSNIGDGDD